MLRNINEAVEPLTQPQLPSTEEIAANKTAAEGVKEIEAANRTPVTEKVSAVVESSRDLVHALESVGAMYGIPATHIISDNKANGITVEDDTIIAPPIPAKNQTKPIIQAIGAVLDYISQRIDDKLNAYQADNINQGRLETKLATCHPVKGKCIGVYDDDNGDEIRAYDSGLVDMPNTPAARAKVEELRASNTIPSFDPGIKDKQPGDDYFNDEDVAAGIDVNASSDVVADKAVTECNDVAKNIQESAYHLNMISKYNNTTHLGYDMLTAHGFKFVKPIDSVVLEAEGAAPVANEENKEKSDSSSSIGKIKSSDIKYLKFDNKGILDAVKYFNDARAAQDNVKNGNIDLDKFVNDPNYDKALDALNGQFNCRINIRFLKDKGRNGTAGTLKFKEYNKRITVSKSKGFQLGGMPIDILVMGHYVETSAPSNELFGQYFVATILHEIFHNIAAVMRDNAAKSNITLGLTMNLAASAKTAEEKRTIITNYVDTLEELNKGSKLYNRSMKRKLVKQLTALSAVADNDKVQQEMIKNPKKEKNPDEYINKLMKMYKDSTKAANKRQTAFRKTKSVGMFLSASAIFAGLLLPTGPFVSAGLVSVGALSFLSNLGSMAAKNMALSQLKNEYASSQKYEEYYCDLFAAMYKLPVIFFIGDKKYKFTANDFDNAQLDQLARLQKEFNETVMSEYPSTLERNRASVKVAKNLLESGDLEEPMRKYCQWIVDNFSKLENTSIDKIYNTTTFDPKEAENMDKHLDDLINDNNLVLTESYRRWLESEDSVISD